MGIFSAISGLVGGFLGAKERKKDRAQQSYLAHNGVQIKVADAKKAGIHPLYALGASTPGYSPVGSGGIESGMAQAGAGVDAAIKGGSEKAVAKSVIDNNNAQADLYRAQATTLRQNATNNAIGAVGVKNKLPNPGASSVIQTPDGPINVAPGTTSQNIEDNVGGAVAEIVGLRRALAGVMGQINNNQKNPFWYRSKNKKGTYGKVMRHLRKHGKSTGRSRKYGAAY